MEDRVCGTVLRPGIKILGHVVSIKSFSCNRRYGALIVKYSQTAWLSSYHAFCVQSDEKQIICKFYFKILNFFFVLLNYFVCFVSEILRSCALFYILISNSILFIFLHIFGESFFPSKFYCFDFCLVTVHEKTFRKLQSSATMDALRHECNHTHHNTRTVH